MKKLFIFFQKECMEFFRSGKALSLTAAFLLLSLLNPLMTQLTPWLMKMLEGELGDAGLIIGDMKVDASMSWLQFFKNAPMLLIIFAFLFGGIFTNEYQTGTLLLITTKGVERRVILLAKAIFLLLVWTVEYWLGFGVTYFYNDLYWDNSIMEKLFLSGFDWWLLGVWIISLILLFSTLFKSMSVVLLGVGGGIFLSYLIGIIPVLTKYTPTYLMNTPTEKVLPAFIISGILSILAVSVSIPIFNKKQL